MILFSGFLSAMLLQHAAKTGNRIYKGQEESITCQSALFRWLPCY
jgi:hypothetical protein